MANVTIKDLPDKVHAELKRAAGAEGQSLNRYIISLLELSIEERNRRKMMRDGRAEFRRFLASLPRVGESSKMIREDRNRGHR